MYDLYMRKLLTLRDSVKTTFFNSFKTNRSIFSVRSQKKLNYKIGNL